MEKAQEQESYYQQTMAVHTTEISCILPSPPSLSVFVGGVFLTLSLAALKTHASGEVT